MKSESEFHTYYRRIIDRFTKFASSTEKDLMYLKTTHAHYFINYKNRQSSLLSILSITQNHTFSSSKDFDKIIDKLLQLITTKFYSLPVPTPFTSTTNPETTHQIVQQIMYTMFNYQSAAPIKTTLTKLFHQLDKSGWSASRDDELIKFVTGAVKPQYRYLILVLFLDRLNPTPPLGTLSRSMSKLRISTHSRKEIDRIPIDELQIVKLIRTVISIDDSSSLNTTLLELVVAFVKIFDTRLSDGAKDGDKELFGMIVCVIGMKNTV